MRDTPPRQRPAYRRRIKAVHQALTLTEVARYHPAVPKGRVALARASGKTYAPEFVKALGCRGLSLEGEHNRRQHDVQYHQFPQGGGILTS